MARVIMNRLLHGLIVTGALLLAATGCLPTPAPAAKPTAGASASTLIVAVPNDPKGANPLVDANNEVQGVANNVYSKLVKFDSTAAVVPDLAESWDIQDQGATYVLHLAKGVTWHDGQAFTSADVKFTLEAILQSGFQKSRLQDVTSVDAPDPNTVVVKLKSPSGVLLAVLADAGTHMLPKHLYDATKLDANPNNLKPVGTGPFKFDDYQAGQFISMVANDKYFRGRPGVDKLVFRFLPQIESAEAALEAGEVQALTQWSGVPYRDVARYQSDARFNAIHWGNWSTTGIMFNLTLKPFDDHRVREAIMRAIDRKKITDTVYSGVPTPAPNASPLQPAVAWAYKKDTPDYAYDPSMAQALMDQTGLPKDAEGMRIHARLDYNVGPGNSDMFSLIKDMLKTIGIDVQLNQYDQAAWFAKLNNKDFDIISAGFGVGPDPDKMRLVYGTSGSFNQGGYSNPKVDQLFDQAARTSNLDDRRTAYYQIQDQVAADLPEVPIWIFEQVEIWNKSYSGRAPFSLYLTDLANIKFAAPS
jgi:peptide/nickel transport system substrate-binding protein